MKAKAALLKPQPVVRWQSEPGRGSTNRKFVGQNPTRGAQVYVALTAKAQKAGVKILDYDGSTVYLTTVSTEPGLHKVTWSSLIRTAPPRPAAVGEGTLSRLAGNLVRRAVAAAPGTYKVVLTVDDKEFSQPLKIEADPAYPTADAEAGEEESENEGDADIDSDRVIDID